MRQTPAWRLLWSGFTTPSWTLAERTFARFSTLKSVLVDGIEILLWPHRAGLGAFVAPWSFDLWFDDVGLGSITADRRPLSYGNYAAYVDRYRALDGRDRAEILKAALARREEYLDMGPAEWEHYLVRSHESGLDEAAFLRTILQFIEAWRKQR